MPEGPGLIFISAEKSVGNCGADISMWYRVFLEKLVIACRLSFHTR